MNFSQMLSIKKFIFDINICLLIFWIFTYKIGTKRLDNSTWRIIANNLCLSFSSSKIKKNDKIWNNYSLKNNSSQSDRWFIPWNRTFQIYVEYNHLKTLILTFLTSLKMYLEFTGRHSGHLGCNKAVESQICKSTSQKTASKKKILRC